MDLQILTQRAVSVRTQYAALERSRYGRAWSNEEIMLGFLGDVGDLAKLVMAKEGVRTMSEVDTKLAHELADCLWCVLVLAQRYEIDLQSAFCQTMDEIEASIVVQINLVHES
jgi:NTP pyrophosphatase (non-canonical NTP hydrolase)